MSVFGKQDLAKAVADKTGLSMKDAGAAIAAFAEVVASETHAGKTVSVSGFGRFTMKDRAERAGRNPATGEALTIPASRRLTFRPAKA